MADNIIETKDLTKKYGEFVAVDSLNLAVKQGEVFGLLGPNGAGKTTTILMLLGLTEPTSGKVKVLGFNPARQPLSVKSRAGYIPDQVGFYDELTARENLVYIARLNGLSRQETKQRIDEALVEAKHKGIVPFALTVDKEGHDYLGQMCGDMAYEVLGDIELLPSRLPTLYRRLTE